MVEKTDKHLTQLSSVIIEELKGLATAGKELNSDSLMQRLSKRSTVQALLQNNRSTSETKFEKEVRSKDDRQGLEKKLEKTLEQKERLLKQISQLENQTSQANDFYNHSINTLIDLFPTEENKPLSESLTSIRRLAKRNAPINDLEKAFSHLKNTAFKLELRDSTPDRKQSKGLAKISFWNKKELEPASEGEFENTYLERVKNIYREIIRELTLHLDADSVQKLTKIDHQIKAIDSLDALLSVRNKILALLQHYITRISEEREEAATFIREIGERLLQLESHMLESLLLARESRQADTEFAVDLENQLNQFRGNVDFSQSLSELKATVISSINSIQKVVENKRQRDMDFAREADEQMGLLHEDLDSMKNEIATAQERARQLEQELLMDPLTGVFNRRAYDRRIKEELQRYQRYKHAFSVLLFDVDHFKKINDKYGHAVGDRCLKEIVKRIASVLRETDFLARYGGEEFIVLLPETASQGALQVADKLRKVIMNMEFIHKKDIINVTISLGVTEVISSDRRPDAIFNRMDQAMYQAKNAGRNRVEIQ